MAGGPLGVTMEPPSQRTEALLAQMGWVRELAARLVRDPHRADDVAQEAMTLALSSPGRTSGVEQDDSRTRAWLARVVRNLIRQSRRSESRRSVREHRVARENREPGSDDLLQRLAVHRDLVGAVESLDEPYRTTLLLRYFDELPPRDIADRTGVPVKTVKTRLSRALALLRSRLEKVYGAEGRDLTCALLAFVRPPVAAPAAVSVSTLGLVAMNAKTLLAVTTLIVGGSVAGLYITRLAPPSAELRAPSLADRARPDSSDTIERPSAETVRVATSETLQDPQPRAAGTQDPHGSAVVPPRVLRAVRGRVLDADARPVADVPLVWRGGEPVVDSSGSPVHTYASGVFEIDHVDTSGTLEVVHAGLVTVLFGSVDPASTIEPVIVVAPAGPFEGRVIDEAGVPIDDALLRLSPPSGFDSRFPMALEGSERRSWIARSDDRGRFRIAAGPIIDGSNLRASAEGFEPSVVQVPLGASSSLDVVLARHPVLEGVLRGEVLDAFGRRVEGARVSMGAFSTVSDANGQFGIDPALSASATRMIAVKEGSLPGVADRPDDGWPGYVVLELGAAPLSISGRVLGGDGEPRAGVEVWVHDTTDFGLVGGTPISVESLLASAELPSGIRLSPGALARAVRDGGHFDDDREPDAPNALWHWEVTDAAGRFTIDGLLPRSYTLRALDRKTLQIEERADVLAGAGEVQIEFSSSGMRENVGGRVVSRAGQPLAGVSVTALIIPKESRFQFGNVRIESRNVRYGDAIVTDEQGRFEFDALPRTGVCFSYRGDSVLPGRVEVGADELAQGPELVATAKCLVEVVLDEPYRADAVAFRDVEGRGVDVITIRGGAISARTHQALVDGRSGVVAIPEDAVELVLLAEGEIVDELEVRPIPGETLEIRP